MLTSIVVLSSSDGQSCNSQQLEALLQHKSIGTSTTPASAFYLIIVLLLIHLEIIGDWTEGLQIGVSFSCICRGVSTKDGLSQNESKSTVTDDQMLVRKPHNMHHASISVHHIIFPLQIYMDMSKILTKCLQSLRMGLYVVRNVLKHAC